MGMPAACEPKTRFHRRNGTQDVEKRGIGRNLKVEVEETVNQDASNAQSCRERRTAHAVPWPRSAVIPPPSRGCQHWSSRRFVIPPGLRLREFLLSRTNMCPCNKSPLHAQKNSYYSSHE